VSSTGAGAAALVGVEGVGCALPPNQRERLVGVTGGVRPELLVVAAGVTAFAAASRRNALTAPYESVAAAPEVAGVSGVGWE
jgi:hypothetical protein